MRPTAPMSVGRAAGVPGSPRVHAIVAAWAAVVATAGDLLMLWVANARRPELGLPEAPAGALWGGAALGVAAIPLYVVGYRAAARLLEPHTPAAARTTRVAGTIGVLIGAVIHGVTAWHIRDEILAGTAGRPPHAVFLESGSVLNRLGMLCVSASAIAAAAFAWGGLHRPRLRTAALANPAFGTIALTALALPSEWSRSFLGAAAPNLAHVIFFVACARAAMADDS